MSNLENRPYVRASVVINSLRDNGYKNTAYAIAELIDNSIQAEATHVQLICFERVENVNGRNRTKIEKIAVADNGTGMSPELLQAAVAFGESQNRNNPYGMGKFGMGLPNSSISQCLRTDVWSWEKDSPPYHTYLDVAKIEEGGLEHVPTPEMKRLHPCMRDVYQQAMPESGTVVLWSELDRLHWKTSRSIYKHAESIIGRMYRRQINSGKVRISFRVFEYDPQSDHYQELLMEKKDFRPNDPMYLMANTTLPPLPDLVKGEVPFEVFGHRELIWRDASDDEHIVTIRTSRMKEEILNAITAISSDRAGATVWGKHMAKNIGVSVMRAERELDLIKDLVKTDQYEYLGRWYGIEIDFPPALDHIFGVTNNKQSATKIRPISPELLMSMLDTTEFSDEEIESLSDNAQRIPDRRLKEILDKLEEADPETHFLYVVLDTIKKMAREVDLKNRELKFEGRNRPTSKAGEASPNQDVEAEATKKGEKRDRKYGGNTDPTPPSPDDIKDLIKPTGKYTTPEAIKNRVDEIIENSIKVIIEDVELPPNVLFDVSSKEGLTLLSINMRHPFYKKIIANSTPEQNQVLKLSLAAWAKMESDARAAVSDRLELARIDWGESLFEFLSDET